MQLVNEFVVPRPIDQTWAVLTDVERIAPAMPGAQLTERVDDQYHGTVKVKVGPVSAQYRGVAQFKELDPVAHHIVLEATGKESSGRGRATALVTSDLTEDGTQTRVKVVTELTISGPLAQFGRGAMAEVSSRLIGQFVANLETMVLADEPVASTRGPAGASATSAGPDADAPPATTPTSEDAPSGLPPELTVSRSTAPRSDDVASSVPVVSQAQPSAAPPGEMNLLKVAAWPVLKRVLPVIVVVAAVVVVIVVFA